MLNLRQLIPATEEKIVGVLIFLFPIFFLTIKGWSNTISILLFLIAVVSLVRNPGFYFLSRGKDFWVIFVSLSLPFFAEVLVQTGRWDITGRTLDGPFRFLAAAFFFVYLSRLNGNFIRGISAGAMMAVLITSLSVFSFTEYYWEGRAATYFVDPITLATFLVACLALIQPSLPVMSPERHKIFLATYVISFALVAFVALLSQSRTSWVALIALLEVLIYFKFKREKKLFVLGNFALIFFVFLSFYLSGVLQTRFYETGSDLANFFSGHTDTSVGLRLGLIQMDIILFLNYPIFGVADGQLPPIDWFSAQGLQVSERLYTQKLLTGSHSEILAHLARKGVLGIPVVIFLFLFPAFYFFKSLKFQMSIENDEAKMGLAFCLVILVSSFFIQVLNLKMTSTFYSFILAIFFAQIFKKNEAREIDHLSDTV